MARNRKNLASVPAASAVSTPAPLGLPTPRFETVALDRLDFSPFNKRTFREGDPEGP